MPVALDAIGLEVVAGFGHQGVDLRLAPCPGHARGAVGDQVRRVDQLVLEQRRVAQLHRGRVAAGVADEAGLLDGLAVDLGQAIHRLGQQIGAAVRHAVPLLKFSQVLQAEISGQVDHLDARGQQLARLRHGHAMRRGEEHDVAGFQIGFVRRHERQVNMATQAGVHVGDRHASFLAAGDGLDLDLGVLRQQAQQFDARVARATNDADLDHDVSFDAWSEKLAILGGMKKNPPQLPGRVFLSDKPAPTAAGSDQSDQRLLNCFRRRAPCRPTFLRSTSRASRVTKPARLKSGLSAASKSIRARVTPWRTAPA